MTPSCTDGVKPLTGDCLFCEIAAGRRKAAVVYEDSEVVAFKDIMPQAPTHLSSQFLALLARQNRLDSLNHKAERQKYAFPMRYGTDFLLSIHCTHDLHQGL